ncbi:ferrochelatase [Pseudoteredinibacter isoporae]|nr:ferrochelatase [Pseudoteredinibacter isoporae]NHO85668.1 ferrochelatase [Pseudoteredinibacter isoporae]NIB25880.1 ferrochelatase [Pseudoteredinibacter isoporae]
MAETANPHQKAAQAPIAVLLCNLGTPEAPTASALRPYLKQFLSDPRVVEVPRLLWWVILRLFILPFRPRASAKLYKQIWTENGSPLLKISRQQQSALQDRLDAHFGAGQYQVHLAMNYGKPSFSDELAEIRKQFSDQVIVLPLYPQYCGATTASAFDALSKELRKQRWVPSLRFINGYHDHPFYIAALKASLLKDFEKNGQPQKLIISYHGTPKSYLEKGDPYYCFCMKTSRLLAEALGLSGEQYESCFQSRFGKQEWLQPYTDIRLEQLPEEGTKDVAVICPGFSADCLETLEEIAVENRDTFLHAGGESYRYIPCLNQEAEHINFLAALVQENGFSERRKSQNTMAVVVA